MPPRIKDTLAWQQAELLMQPAFIRVIDQIRKHLDESAWKGTYENVMIWPSGTTDETKELVINLLQQLDNATPEQFAEIEQAVSQLPTPQPGYQLNLQHQGLGQVSVDLWELCYQVCFRNYNPSLAELASYEVEIDTTLIDETGDVDWQRLDAKAGELVDRVFSSLPTMS